MAPLHLWNAEGLPFADASFDLAISVHGAPICYDPYTWIPEATRVLRPRTRLVFLANGVLVMLRAGPEYTEDVPVTECVKRPSYSMHRFEWPDDDSVKTHIGHGCQYPLKDNVAVWQPWGGVTRVCMCFVRRYYWLSLQRT